MIALNYIALDSGVLLFFLITTKGLIQLDGLIAFLVLIPLFSCLAFLKLDIVQKVDPNTLLSANDINETLFSLKKLQMLSLFESKAFHIIFNRKALPSREVFNIRSFFPSFSKLQRI